MPETDVTINFKTNGEQLKRDLSELEARGRDVERALGSIKLGGGGWTLSPEDQRALEAWKALRGAGGGGGIGGGDGIGGLRRAIADIKEIKQEADGASESFGKLGGMLERMALRLVILSLIRDAIKAVGTAIKEALDIQEAEVRFQNMVDLTEHGAEVFQDLRKAAEEYNIDFRKEAEPTIRMLVAQGVAEEDLKKRFTDLAQISMAYGADLKTITSQFEQIQETGTVSLQQLIKMSNELHGSFREQVAALREAEDEYKRIETETAQAEKAFRQQSEAADKATESQVRLAEKLGLTKPQEQVPQMPGTLGAAATFEQYYRQLEDFRRRQAEAIGEGPGIGILQVMQARAARAAQPDTSALSETIANQINLGIGKLMHETGWSREQVEGLRTSGQLDTQFFLSEGRQATADAQRAQLQVFEHVREFEKDRYARQRTEIAQQITPEAVTGRPGFQDQVTKVMGTLAEQLGKLSDPLGKIMTNTAETAKSSEGLYALLAGGT